MQILAIDLGTDLLPALALGAEPAEPGVMERPPRPREQHVITARLLRRAYLWLGLLQAGAALLAFFAAYRLRGFVGWLGLPGEGAVYRSATSAALAAVVATQIGNLFAQRTERVSLFRVGLGGNRLLYAGIAAEVALLLAIVYLPPLQRAFGTAPPPAGAWLLALATTPLLVAADELRKRWQRHRNRATG
jgi:magnesium-transporting ATPase (P-type)